MHLPFTRDLNEQDFKNHNASHKPCYELYGCFQSKSAGVMAAADLHLVQHRPSNIWSNSGQCKGGHMTLRHKVLSALLFIPTPPLMPFAQERSSGTVTLSAQHKGQQVPASSGLVYLKGGLQSTAAHEMPEQVSDAPFPGEYTGYRAAAMVRDATQRKHFIAILGYVVFKR